MVAEVVGVAVADPVDADDGAESAGSPASTPARASSNTAA